MRATALHSSAIAFPRLSKSRIAEVADKQTLQKSQKWEVGISLK